MIWNIIIFNHPDPINDFFSKLDDDDDSSNLKSSLISSYESSLILFTFPVLSAFNLFKVSLVNVIRIIPHENNKSIIPIVHIDFLRDSSIYSFD